MQLLQRFVKKKKRKYGMSFYDLLQVKLTLYMAKLRPL